MNILLSLAKTTKIAIGSGGANIEKVDASQLLTNGLNLAYFIAGVVAVIVIIIAGYTFTTSVYDQAKITQAKNNLLYAVVGLVVVIFAFVITQFIMGRF